MNPLDEMSWEQRFWAAWEALCAMERRAEGAEALLREQPLTVTQFTRNFKLKNQYADPPPGIADK